MKGHEKNNREESLEKKVFIKNCNQINESSEGKCLIMVAVRLIRGVPLKSGKCDNIFRNQLV
jgi:hypothetical protein